MYKNFAQKKKHKCEIAVYKTRIKKKLTLLLVGYKSQIRFIENFSFFAYFHLQLP